MTTFWTLLMILPVVVALALPRFLASSKAVDPSQPQNSPTDVDVDRILDRVGDARIAFVGWDRTPGRMMAVIGLHGHRDLLILRTFPELVRSRQEFPELESYIRSVALELGPERVADVRVPPKAAQQNFGWVGGGASLWWRADRRSIPRAPASGED